LQTLTAPPREHLTADQVRAIVRGHVDVDIGADLLDADGAFLEDLTSDLQAGGSVELNSHRTVHRTCRVLLSRELDWGAVRLRLWMTLASKTTGLALKAFVGVFLLETPTTVTGRTPRTWVVEGYDLLGALAVDGGRTYRVAAGTKITDAVVQAIAAAGITATVQLASTGDAPTLPSDMVWSMRDDVTWLRIVNDLLAAGGYRGLWADHLGRYRSEPYRPPQDRGVEWEYDAGHVDTILGDRMELTTDLWQIPNRWVFYVDDPARGEPVAGDTLYIVDTPDTDPTSAAARGRVIPRKVAVDAADHASLVSQGDRIAARDREVTTRAAVTVGANPLHGHFDVIRLVDAEAGVSGKWQVTSWSLPLDGSDMTLDAKAVS
jgi:hypothetical protein